MNEINRRQFMKKAIVMGTTIAAFPAVNPNKSQAGNIAKMVVHPNVDNLRVIGITDTAMTKANEPDSTWLDQDKLVVKEPVWKNIDKLACGLAETENSTEAWRSIFIRPPSKSWSDTTVAIKTNNIAWQHTRSAVMAKICHTLTDVLGVNPSNISIYDGMPWQRYALEDCFYRTS